MSEVKCCSCGKMFPEPPPDSHGGFLIPTCSPECCDKLGEVIRNWPDDRLVHCGTIRIPLPPDFKIGDKLEFGITMPDSLKPEDHVRRPVLPRIRPCSICHKPATINIPCYDNAIRLCGDVKCTEDMIKLLVEEAAAANRRAHEEPAPETLPQMIMSKCSDPVYLVAGIFAGLIALCTTISFIRWMFS